ncbi:hypothetical protein RUM43_012172 [Polyplax serrata]|uniref:Uncharacterized protein n=1 Tax=Polyplax serrata TaxID=468196 RepID=A0AAN8NK78_POLSC
MPIQLYQPKQVFGQFVMSKREDEEEDENDEKEIYLIRMEIVKKCRSARTPSRLLNGFPGWIPG